MPDNDDLLSKELADTLRVYLKRPGVYPDKVYVFAVAQKPGGNYGDFLSFAPICTLAGRKVEDKEFPPHGLAFYDRTSSKDKKTAYYPGDLVVAEKEDNPRKNPHLFRLVEGSIRRPRAHEIIEICDDDREAWKEGDRIVGYHGTIAYSFAPYVAMVNAKTADLEGPFQTECIRSPDEDEFHYYARADSSQRILAPANIAKKFLEPPFCFDTKVTVSKDDRPRVLSDMSGGRPRANPNNEDVTYSLLVGANAVQLTRLERHVRRELETGLAAIDVAFQDYELIDRLADRLLRPQSPEKDRLILEACGWLYQAQLEAAANFARKFAAGGWLTDILTKAFKDYIMNRRDRQEQEIQSLLEKEKSDVMARFLEVANELLEKLESKRAPLQQINVSLSQLPATGSTTPAPGPAQPLALPMGLSRRDEEKPLRFEKWVTTRPTDAAKVSEKDFFDRFEAHTKKCGFDYRPSQLQSFHLSMKSSDFVILGGLSGTGKSWLPELYAQALAGDRQENDDDIPRFLRIAVNPTWLEIHDVLGRLNVFDQVFQPAESGLYTFLIQADVEHKSRGEDSGLYVVVLDEMNVAQVEHYFMPILQELGKDVDFRKIRVFDRTQVFPKHRFENYAQLNLPPTLRVTGTVNYDETTGVSPCACSIAPPKCCCRNRTWSGLRRRYAAPVCRVRK